MKTRTGVRVGLTMLVLTLVACDPPPAAESIARPVVDHCDTEIIPGFTACGGDNNVYIGDLVLFSYTGFTGCCMRITPSVGGNWSPAGGLPWWGGRNGIRSFKSALLGPSRFCTGTWNCNPNGTTYTIGPQSYGSAIYITDFSNFDTHGMVLNN